MNELVKDKIYKWCPMAAKDTDQKCIEDSCKWWTEVYPSEYPAYSCAINVIAISVSKIKLRS